MVLPPVSPRKTVLATPCMLEVTADLSDERGEGELLGTRIAASGDDALVEWERRGRDDVEGWSGAFPHFAFASAASFPKNVIRDDVGVSSAVMAPYAVAAPLGGLELASLVYGQHIDWAFRLSPVTNGAFATEGGAPYVPPSYVPVLLEAASSDAFRAVAITTGSDLDGKRVDECFGDGLGSIPPCRNRLWGPRDLLGIIGYPRHGAPWTKKIRAPVPPIPGEKLAEIGPAAIALHGTRGAYAFRYKDAMWLGWIGPTADDVTTPTKIRQGRLGAPTMAIAGDELMVMWAERPDDTAPWHLASMRFDGARSPSAVETLETGFAPSLAAEDGRYTLVWMDGDASKTGWLRAARFARGSEPDLSSASFLTPKDANARDPEVAVAAGHVWIAWQDFTKARSLVRVAALGCR
jgi:hypothetical protein